MVVQFDLFVHEAIASGDLTPTSRQNYYKAEKKALVKVKNISRKLSSVLPSLRRLSKSSNHEHKIAVADHSNTTLAEHFELAEDENPDVRYALAENHNISRDVLNKLKEDSNPYVANRAERTLARLQMHDCEFLSWRACRLA